MIESRWFRVTAERFDWVIRKGLMRSWPHDAIGYGTESCITFGLRTAQIEVIKKPEGAYVGKDGQVYWK